MIGCKTRRMYRCLMHLVWAVVFQSSATPYSPSITPAPMAESQGESYRHNLTYSMTQILRPVFEFIDLVSHGTLPYQYQANKGEKQ